MKNSHSLEESSNETPKASAVNISLPSEYRKNNFREKMKANETQDSKEFFLNHFKSIQSSYSSTDKIGQNNSKNSNKKSLWCEGNVKMMNICLLCLLNIEELKTHFIEKFLSGELMEKPLSIIFGKLFLIKSCIKSGVIDTSFIKNYVQENCFLFHSCSFIDLFHYFIDQFIEESEENNNVIETVFNGKFERSITCLQCETKKCTLESFSDLNLEVSQSIERSLEIFNREGRIMNYCVKCEETINSSQRLTIVGQPLFLVIHFKRFIESPYLHKSNTFIKIKKKLIINDDQYEIINVIVHNGEIDNGTYEGYFKFNKKWYFYDEKNLTKIASSDVFSQNAYVLIYKKI